jgi:hypothetical protein
MAPDFEKANEIYFRLGIIYKQQAKYDASLDVSNVLSWLTLADSESASVILYQIHRSR